MTKWLLGIGAVLLLAGGLILTSGCVGVGYEGGVAYYDYDYYPDWDIYYYPRGHAWYWSEGGSWHSGRALPRHYVVEGHAHESLHLQTRQPWSEHPAGHH